MHAVDDGIYEDPVLLDGLTEDEGPLRWELARLKHEL